MKIQSNYTIAILAAIGVFATAMLSVSFVKTVFTDSGNNGTGESTYQDVGESAAGLILAPADVQELVNRADAVLVGKIASGPVIADEGPFDEAGNIGGENQVPFARYRLQIDQLFVDDGAVASRPEVRFFAYPVPPEINLDGTFLFALTANPDGSYGTSAGWGMIELSSGVPTIKNRSPEFLEGQSSESLLKDVSVAASQYERVPVSEWPRRQS